MKRRNSSILIADDETANVRLLQGDLREDDYEHFLVAHDGHEAWRILEEQHEIIGLVIMNRTLPGMDAMQVLEKMKRHPAMRRIPVIMQTAAGAKEQMLEGIAAGVYYYLAKPYDESTMRAVVSAAIRDYAFFKQMLSYVQKFRSKLHLIKDSRFHIKSLDDASYLSTFLAGFFPDPERVVLGLGELFINAIEHGNLDIGYAEKTDLLTRGVWREEIERRLELPEHRDKYAEVFYLRDESEILVQIKDQGKGFDWDRYLVIDPERAMHTHGRGIAMARMISFDALEYQGSGNEVMCRVLKTPPPQ